MADIAIYKDEIKQLGDSWKNDPVKFARDVFNIELAPWQAEVAMALVNNERISIKSGHGVGKSFALSVIIFWWLVTKAPCTIACTAPSGHQLEDVLWAQLYSLHGMMIQEIRDMIVLGSEKITINGRKDCFVVARTARQEKPDAFQGFHSANMLLVVDEASGVPEKIFEVGAGTMSTEGAKTILVGNPTNTTGYFYDTFNANAKSWVNFTVSCLDSPLVDLKYVEFMKEEYGEDSDVYAVRVLGEFPRSDNKGLIRRSVLMDAVEMEADPHGDIVWGVDVARGGGDRCALAKRYENVIHEEVYARMYEDTMDFVGYIYEEYKNTPDELRPVMIYVDVVGLGGPVVDRLKQLGLPVKGIHPQKTVNSKDAKKMKDDLFWKMKRWFESGKVKMVEDKKLIHELTTIRGTHNTPDGTFKVEGKDSYRDRERKSPDLVDALALTFAHKPVFNKRLRRETEYVNMDYDIFDY